MILLFNVLKLAFVTNDDLSIVDQEQTALLDSTELCVSYNTKADDDDAIECQWCSCWEHKVCAKINSEQYLLLDSTPLNAMFFARHMPLEFLKRLQL